MLSLDEIRKKIQDHNLSAVARATGMHRQHLWRLVSGDLNNPTMRTLERLTEYLESK